MQLEIWSLGRDNEKHFAAAIDHYLKQLNHYNPAVLHTFQLSKKEATTDAALMKAREGELILKRLQPGQQLIVLDERGRQLTSPQWAQQLQQYMNQSTRSLVFLIGGAYGVSDAVKAKAAQMWSLGPLVFPHQLVRLILAEQLYRAFSILHGSPYHHE